MSELRVAVLGVGMMGADHVARITSKIAGARVSVVNDYVTEKAEQLAASIPGCRAICRSAGCHRRPRGRRRRAGHSRSDA